LTGEHYTPAHGAFDTGPVRSPSFICGLQEERDNHPQMNLYTKSARENTWIVEEKIPQQDDFAAILASRVPV